jgi:uncharacterized membrane protein
MSSSDVLLPLEASSELPKVQTIHIADLYDVLKKGVDDFWAMPTHVIFLGLIYPLAGLFLAGATFDIDFISYLYPLAAGFALVGPLAAIGLYELSRRRELGLDTSWRHAFDVIHSPSRGPIVKLGLLLLLVFLIWIACADAIFRVTLGFERFSSFSDFARTVLTTPQGHALIIIGNLVGLLFAALAATLSVISFPLLLDRNVGFSAAVYTSIMVVGRNHAAHHQTWD